MDARAQGVHLHLAGRGEGLDQLAAGRRLRDRGPAPGSSSSLLRIRRRVAGGLLGPVPGLVDCRLTCSSSGLLGRRAGRVEGLWSSRGRDAPGLSSLVCVVLGAAGELGRVGLLHLERPLRPRLVLRPLAGVARVR